MRFIPETDPQPKPTFYIQLPDDQPVPVFMTRREAIGFKGKAMFVSDGTLIREVLALLRNDSH